ncbi:MAG: DNA-processing protein DprA [Spirochaetaceae bacterium]|jgi:DNA processing protein|nr:DNA-processing protein DprA [Spirochaetaceae bacterium]
MERGLLDFIIAAIPGISPRDRLFLCEKFDREDEISILSREDIEKILQKSLNRHAFNMEKVLKQADADYRRTLRQGIGYISWKDAEYPPLLREINDPPVLLFFRGSLPRRDRVLAALVGTRKPSGQAARSAYEFGRDLGRAGVSVVSGLALGIDAMAHRGAVDGASECVAVLGSGVDMVYPASNRGLAGKILEQGGALLSEYVPGTAPARWRFPARNRIIAGLCRGTLIIEAGEHSGALITAQFALDEGRDLWVARAGIDSPLGEGTRRLASDGAPVLENAAELLSEWQYAPPAEKTFSNKALSEKDFSEKEFSKTAPCTEGEALAFSLMKDVLHIHKTET